MEIIDGKKVAAVYKERLKEEIEKLPEAPSLAVMSIGDDAASEIYIRLKRKMCEELGMKFTHYTLPKDSKQEELTKLIEKLNDDKSVNGVMLQSPIPYHLNILKAFELISPEKDVDGFSPVNVGGLLQGQDVLTSCTPLGIMHMLKEYNIEVSGKNCVVVGRSNIVGRPLGALLLNADGTVTICHSRTKDLAKVTREADLLFVAIGKPKFITADMIKDGAVVVDVGINRIDENKKIVGDVDFDNVKEKCSYITPVPGGVGPMTIITLMENVVKAYKIQNGIID